MNTNEYTLYALILEIETIVITIDELYSNLVHLSTKDTQVQEITHETGLSGRWSFNVYASSSEVSSQRYCFTKSGLVHGSTGRNPITMSLRHPCQ